MRGCKILFIVLVLFGSHRLIAQGCCSGGSGSPIAGGTSQGVLGCQMTELAMNYQYINSNKFLTGDKKAMDYLDNFNTNYLYARVAQGITDHFTLSIESGFFLNKTQIAINKKDKTSSEGIGDLIIFPRYKVYEHNTDKTRDEITVGLGYKMPLGKYLDSGVVYTDPKGKNYYTPKPPAVMPTSGANDFIFYGFLYRGYPQKKFRIFASTMYIRKGWNPIGQKFGDYASIGLFASKNIYRNLSATLQLKGEWIDNMSYDKHVDMLATYNIDVHSFGSKKVAIVPQLGYSYKKFSFYLLTDLPLYQYVNGTAIASQFMMTMGAAYRICNGM